MIGFFRFFAVLACIILVAGCGFHELRPSYSRDIITQKLVLDFRYFCQTPATEEHPCQEPVTELPDSIKHLLATYPLGGVILFAENIQSIEQTVRLIDSMQQVSLNSRHQTPLLITIDQEGGIVKRLSSEWSTGFAGNMAIAAMPAHERSEMAFSVGKIIGAELSALGINVNHSPVLDVNSDPTNPVIHVRSFSDQPELVAELGAAMARGFHASNIAATAKHFPGHGNTATDSHIGLPVVNSDRETVYAYDLAPFAHLIENKLSPMIMTAHIQFPALDDHRLVTKNGGKVIAPATLSKKIITGLLRKEMLYDGLVISDALNMKAISELFEPVEAVRLTFDAGVDLALMPLAIRSPEDIKLFEKMLSSLTAYAAENGKNWAESVPRLNSLKTKLGIRDWVSIPVQAKISNARSSVGSEAHKAVEKHLAAQALSFQHGKQTFKPITVQNYKNVQIVFPETDLANAFKQALLDELEEQTPTIQAHSFKDITSAKLSEITAHGDLLIIGNSSPGSSLADLGGMADLLNGEHIQNQKNVSVQSKLQELVALARHQGTPSVYISFKFPYELSPHLNNADYRIAAYNDRLVQEDGGKLTSPTIKALAGALVGKSDMPGTVPITLLPPAASKTKATKSN